MTPKTANNKSLGYVTFALHSHLPMLSSTMGRGPINEMAAVKAAAENYFALLRVFGELERRALGLKANVNLSPILLEQLSHFDPSKIKLPIVSTSKIPSSP